jgi:hypothetical protein
VPEELELVDAATLEVEPELVEVLVVVEVLPDIAVDADEVVVWLPDPEDEAALLLGAWVLPLVDAAALELDAPVLEVTLLTEEPLVLELPLQPMASAIDTMGMTERKLMTGPFQPPAPTPAHRVRRARSRRPSPAA